MRINESFASICGQILLINPLPNINKIFYLIRQDECQRSITISPNIVELIAKFSKSTSINSSSKKIVFS